VTGPASITLDHVFPASGSFNVQVSATDKDGGTSVQVSSGITVSAVALQGTTLVVGGTLGSDSIIIKPSSATSVTVSINGANQGTFNGPGKILILAQAGDDHVLLDLLKVKKTTTYITAPTTIEGGAGNDTLDAVDSKGNNLLLGGEGADTLYGGAGRDLLIGGLGADLLRAGGNDDILIGGTTDFDTDAAALARVLAEWGRTNLGYAGRVDHLTGATSGGLNGGNLLTAATVHDDAAVDQLYGEGSQDWFLYQASGGSRDVLRDRKNNERATAV
jgi:Ca2+-binding RTX toxin-like protein